MKEVKWYNSVQEMLAHEGRSKRNNMPEFTPEVSEATVSKPKAKRTTKKADAEVVEDGKVQSDSGN